MKRVALVINSNASWNGTHNPESRVADFRRTLWMDGTETETETHPCPGLTGECGDVPLRSSASLFVQTDFYKSVNIDSLITMNPTTTTFPGPLPLILPHGIQRMNLKMK